MKKEKKPKVVQEVKEKIEKSKMILVLAFAKMKARELFDLRKKAKQRNCELKVVKKRLFERAAKEKNVGIDLDDLHFPLCFLFCYGDEVLGAKLAFEFQENTPLQILRGWYHQKIIGKEEIEFLAKLKSKQELLTDFQILLKSLISRLAFNLSYPLKGLTSILGQIKK